MIYPRKKSNYYFIRELLEPPIASLNNTPLQEPEACIADMATEEVGMIGDIACGEGDVSGDVVCDEGDISPEFTADNDGDTPLHCAASRGCLVMFREMISEFMADGSGNDGITALHFAAREGYLGMVRVLASDFKANVNVSGNNGNTPLHFAAREGHLDVVRVLVSELKADVNASDSDGTTALHCAAREGHLDVVRVLISELKLDVFDNNGITPLQFPAYIYWGALVSELKANVNVCNNDGITPLHLAASRGHLDVVRVLISEFKADVNASNSNGTTPLHEAASRGHLDVVRVLISEFKADVNASNSNSTTPLHEAASRGHVVRVLISEFKADIKSLDDYGNTPLYEAVYIGHLNVVRVLVSEFKADVNVCDNDITTLLQEAARGGHSDVFRVLMSDYNNKLHCAVKRGHVEVDATASDCDHTPLHFAASKAHLVSTRAQRHGVCDLNYTLDEVLPKENVSSNVKGRSLLHIACEMGNINLVQRLSLDHKADVTARDDEGNTPLHVAAKSGREDVVLSLIKGFGCDVHVTGHLGRSLLHSACASNSGSLVRLVGQYISPWVVDDNGNTPLHICARLGYAQSIKALLELDPPVMIRNNLGKTSIDFDSTGLIDAYTKEKKDTIYSHYEIVLRHAKRKYSRPEPITRAFLVGNPGAGKSSLVEALKREDVFDWLWRVSKSYVPPHTASIVPSIHTSKHYGRVLFYDFAGDAEYYSSHAAILENLASSRKGNNVFLLVIDMREEMAEIKKIFRYWHSFIQHRQFDGQKPRLIVLGSHLDLLTEDMARARGKEFQMFYDSIDTEAVQMSATYLGKLS